MTQLLIDTGLPGFSTVLHNSRYIFNKSWFACDNAVVAHLHEPTLTVLCLSVFIHFLSVEHAA